MSLRWYNHEFQLQVSREEVGVCSLPRGHFVNRGRLAVVRNLQIPRCKNSALISRSNIRTFLTFNRDDALVLQCNQCNKRLFVLAKAHVFFPLFGNALIYVEDMDSLGTLRSPSIAFSILDAYLGISIGDKVQSGGFPLLWELYQISEYRICEFTKSFPLSLSDGLLRLLRFFITCAVLSAISLCSPSSDSHSLWLVKTFLKHISVKYVSWSFSPLKWINNSSRMPPLTWYGKTTKTTPK